MERCVNNIRRKVAGQTLEKLNREIEDLYQDIREKREKIERLERILSRTKKVFDKYSK